MALKYVEYKGKPILFSPTIAIEHKGNNNINISMGGFSSTVNL
nr:hypothetical protein [Colwellia sp. PAMC 21821]